jgi:cbb3-type cytochrome c oxidase subunit III
MSLNHTFRIQIQNFAKANEHTEGLLTVWLLISLFLSGASSAIAGEHHTQIPGQTRAGAYIFHNYCSVCHGDKGNGQTRARNGLVPPPRDYTTPEAAIELTRERMIHSVTYGRPGTAMISWKRELSPKEIENVVDYIRANFMQLGDKAVRKVPDSKLLASHGGMLYLQNCAMCHGETGARDMTGRMKPPPRDFTSPEVISELTRERMINSVTNGRPGTAMRGYGDQFSKADVEAMVDFIRKAFMSGSKKPKK